MFIGSSENKSNKNINEIFLPQNACQGEIKVKEGEIFSIKVKGNPTTGFSWFLINEEELTAAGILPTNLNEHKTGDYISHNPKGMCGGGGIFDFQFKVSKITSDMPLIKMLYRRPWLPETEYASKLEIKLLI